MPAKTQLWVQEQKKHTDIQAHAEERAGEVEVMGKINIFPLSNSDEIMSRRLDSHLGG